MAAQGNDAASEFASTPNLFQAAGLIQTKLKHFGDPNLRRFALALCRPAVLVPEKISMLLTGEFSYEGKKLKILNCGWGGPNQKWINRWWIANGRSGENAVTWNRVLPGYKIKRALEQTG